MTTAAARDLDSRAQVHDLVVGFYRELALDDLLAPVFEEVAEVDWAEHIPRLIDYWCRVLLGDESYRGGTILASHRAVHEQLAFRAEHFDRWFALFCAQVDRGWAGPGAEHAKAHAARIAGSLARRLAQLTWAP